MKHSLEQIDLKCGAKLLLINVPNAGSVYFSTSIRGGYWYMSKEKYELPHLLEHLVYSGNKKYPNQFRFMYEIEKNGAFQNAYTGPCESFYYFKCGMREIESITKLAIDQLKSPLFKESDIKSEKEVIEKELSRFLEKDEKICLYKNRQTITPITQSYEYRIQGLKRISRADILAFHKKYFTAKNRYFVISGDFDEDIKKKLISNIEYGLKDCPTGEIIKVKVPTLGNYQRDITTLDTKISTQSHFCVTFVKPLYEEEDMEILGMINAIYNRGHGSKLFQKIRKGGLSYLRKSGFNANPLSYSCFYLQMQTTPEKILKLFGVCLKELADICDNKYTDAEFKRAKGFIMGGNEIGFEEPSSFGQWYRNYFARSIQLKNPQEYNDNTANVTRKDIAKVCKKYFTKDNWCLTLVGQDIDKEKYRKVLDKYFK